MPRSRSYTEQARDVVRLIGSDIGRPLSDLTSTLNYVELIEDSRRVLATLIPKEKEVQDTTGRWYMVRLMPYRTAENVIDGVVMTMVDIDRTKRAERKAVLGRDLVENIIQTVHEPTMVLDGDLKVVSANDAFYHSFGTQSKQTEGLPVFELGNGQWDIPELRKMLEKLQTGKLAVSNLRVTHEFPRIGKKSLTVNARRIEQPDRDSSLVLLAFQQIDGETK